MQYSTQQEAQQQRKEQQLQELLSKHVQTYPINLAFPAKLFPANKNDNDNSSTNDKEGSTKLSYDSRTIVIPF